MKKIIFITSLVFIFLSFSLAQASVGSDVYVNDFKLADYFYEGTFDNLAIDFTIDSDVVNTLNSLVVRNSGTAREGYEIEKLVLYADNGDNVFNGFGVDQEIATAEYVNNYWVFSDINKAINVGLNRFFVTVETKINGTDFRIFDFFIPAFSDSNNNNNNNYDDGDAGIFLEQNKNLPVTSLEVPGSTRYRNVTGDPWKPVSVITNLNDNQLVSQDNLVLEGQSRDQGGSTPVLVEVCIDEICDEVTNTGNDYSSWDYNWADIANGNYEIYVKTLDGSGNIGYSNVLNISVEAVLAPAVFSKENSSVELVNKTALADGIDYIDINVVLKNNYDQVIANKLVFLNEIRDEGPVVIKSKYTDSNGLINFKIRNIQAESYQLTITTEDGDAVSDLMTIGYTGVEELIDYTNGRWIKLANQSTVYFLDKNNVRHIYPTQAVWQSYFSDGFSFVETVSSTEMATYSLGRNVPFKVGTLMKIPSVAKVYYVSYNGKIAWITSADVAVGMFGDSWANQVKDLSESFFTDYVIGNDIF